MYRIYCFVNIVPILLPLDKSHLIVVYDLFNVLLYVVCQYVKYLIISHDTIKILEENMGKKISDIPHSKVFTGMSLRASDIKERINKWYFIKIKSFCTGKENSIKIKREPTVWEDIFANDTSDKGLISKIYKEFT